MSKYSLRLGVFLVTGAKRGAICDANTGNVYSVNGSAVKVLLWETEHDLYWQQLMEMGLAEERPLNQSPSRRLTYQEWCQLVKEGHELGCNAGQFIGGEPFLYKGEGGEDVLVLVEYAYQVGYQRLEIFTNATLLNRGRVKRIKELGLNIAVSLYSSDPQVHDAITRTPGSHHLTMRGLHLLKEAGVPTRVETVIMRPNQRTVPQTIQLVEEMGFGHKNPDPMRPVSRGTSLHLRPSPEIIVQYGLITKPNFRADLKTLSHYASHSEGSSRPQV